MSIRGATFNPANRFEQISFERDEEISDDDYPQAKTVFYKDTAKTVISYNDSPDVGFSGSINPYRGCEHGCIYCYARPTHEYLGFSAGIDFESIIFVKMDAPDILRRELTKKSYQPQVLVMSSITDCYQPFERKFQLTRRCLEVMRDFKNPVGIITKNALVERDIDLFKEMREYKGISVCVTVTTLDPKVAQLMEPRASTPANRLNAIEALASAGIPVTVNVAPIIPGLTEHEIPTILKECAKRGAIGAGYTIVRLPYSVKDLFTSWVNTHFPDRANKILNRIKELRGGVLYKSEFGTRMIGEGLFAEHISDLFTLAYKKADFPKRERHLSAASFSNPNQKQLEFFNN